VRIVAGSRKGHRIDAPKGVVTRPTSDRVREAVFSILGSVGEARVLDLCAGSGAMGLEALSRGAADAVFVERDARAARVVAENAERLGLADRARVVRRDAARALGVDAAGGRRYDLVFVDAPYADWPRLEPRLADLLPRVLAEGARVVVETAADTGAPVLPLDLVTSRRYGSARITVFQR
jgi:16S rRNA (guanine966-N2)-methyltransferase